MSNSNSLRRLLFSLVVVLWFTGQVHAHVVRSAVVELPVSLPRQFVVESTYRIEKVHLTLEMPTGLLCNNQPVGNYDAIGLSTGMDLYGWKSDDFDPRPSWHAAREQDQALATIPLDVFQAAQRTSDEETAYQNSFEYKVPEMAGAYQHLAVSTVLAIPQGVFEATTEVDLTESLLSGNWEYGDRRWGMAAVAMDFTPFGEIFGAARTPLRTAVRGELGLTFESAAAKMLPMRTNAQLIQEVATRSENAVGGSGRFAGTAKHAYADELLTRYQGIYGNRGLLTESTWMNGFEETYGTAGAVRLDVLDTTVGLAYDYKFSLNPPNLRADRIRQIMTHGPSLNGVIEVNP